MLFRTAALALIVANPLLAMDFSDPSWPCIQPRVEHLSYGVIWPEEISGATLSPAAEALAERLALRRLSLDEAQILIQDFASTGPEPAQFGAVFLAAFTRMDRDRTRLLGGIARYSLSQIALAEKIEGIRAEMAAIMAGDTPDYDRVDQLEETLDWDERIYKDRQSALSYVCESPVLLEKRIYAVGQMLLAARP